MDFLSVISGAFSALIGAYIYHWIDKVRTRKKAVEILTYELKINKSLAEMILKDLSRKSERLLPLFLFNAYNFVIISDPQLADYIVY